MRSVTLNVGTFNIAAGLIPDTQAINRLITTYDLDIVGLQEVDQNTQRNPYDMLVSVAGETYPHRYYCPTINGPNGGKYGLGIISKFPILSSECVTYSVTGEEERLYQKVVISVAGEAIHFFNTHLAFESRDIREAQTRELIAGIDMEKNIVVGDFNFSETVSEWKGFGDFILANKLSDLKDTFRYKDDTMNSFAIDNIMVSKNLLIGEVEVSPTPLSDYALMVTQVSF